MFNNENTTITKVIQKAGIENIDDHVFASENKVRPSLPHTVVDPHKNPESRFEIIKRVLENA